MWMTLLGGFSECSSPWTWPSTCLSNGSDTWVGRCTLGTLRLFDEVRMIFLWPGMKQPGGLNLTFFICANVSMCVKDTEAHWKREKEEEKLCFTYSKVCVVQNWHRCRVSRLEEDRWSGLERRSSPLPTWNCCSSINAVQQHVCPLGWWKAPLCITIN